MTITYPRPLWLEQMRECTFSISEHVSTPRTDSGRALGAVEYADPYIRGRFETRSLWKNERAQGEAWKASLRGGLKTFLTHHLAQPELFAYPLGHPDILSSSWNGQGTVSAIAARLITAGGAPAGFTMTVGDWIGLVQSNRYCIFRVTETVTRGASTIAVPVEPFIPLNIFTTSATVVFWRPKCEFVLLSDTWDSRDNLDFAPITFEAVQKI